MAVDLNNVKRLVELHQAGLDDEGGGPSSDGWDDNNTWYDRFTPGYKLTGGLKQAIEEMIVELETCHREHTHTDPDSPTSINS